MANKITYHIEFKADTSGLTEAKARLSELEQISTRAAKGAGVDKVYSQQIKAAAESASKLSKMLNDSYNAKLGTTDLRKFNELLISSDTSLSDMRKTFDDIDRAEVFDNLFSGVLNTNVQLRESNTLLNKMAETMGNTIRWGITSGILNTFTGAIQGAYSYIIKLDKSLNNIRIVTGKSADEMQRFANQANETAKALGSTTLENTEASLIYYQQGYGDEEVEKRAEVTIKAANVAKTSAEEMSEYLTAVWNGYAVSAEQAELYVDKLSKVAATTASNLQELSTGMSRVASVANTLGVDVDQLNGMLATIISTTRQAPESAGVALKTIFSRIEDLSLGETDEEGVDFGDVEAELNKLGISIANEKGELRDLGETIEEIGDAWQNWNKEQKTSIAIAMAGTR